MGAWTVLVSTGAGCETPGLLGWGVDTVCGDTAIGLAEGVCTVDGSTTVSAGETDGFCGVGGTTSRGLRCCATARDAMDRLAMTMASSGLINLWWHRRPCLCRWILTGTEAYHTICEMNSSVVSLTGLYYETSKETPHPSSPPRGEES